MNSSNRPPDILDDKSSLTTPLLGDQKYSDDESKLPQFPDDEDPNVFVIGADELFYAKEEFPPELAQLSGRMTPLHFMQDKFADLDDEKGFSFRKFLIGPKAGGVLSANLERGKQPALLSITYGHINELPSLRGKPISMDRLGGLKPSVNTFKLFCIQNEVAGLSKTFPYFNWFRGRGWEDLVTNLLGIGLVNHIYARVSTVLEAGLKVVGSGLNQVFRLPWQMVSNAWKKDITSNMSWGQRAKQRMGNWRFWAGGALSVLTSPFWAASQALHFAGNALSYSRHLLDGVTNLFSTTMSFFGGNYGKKYPTFGVCFKAIGKNLLLSALTAGVLALCIIPGGQIAPLLAHSFTVAAGTNVAAAAVAGLTGLSAIAGISIGAQAVLGLTNLGMITRRARARRIKGAAAKDSKDLIASLTATLDKLQKKIDDADHNGLSDKVKAQQLKRKADLLAQIALLRTAVVPEAESRWVTATKFARKHPFWALYYAIFNKPVPAAVMLQGQDDIRPPVVVKPKESKRDSTAAIDHDLHGGDPAKSKSVSPPKAPAIAKQKTSPAALRDPFTLKPNASKKAKADAKKAPVTKQQQEVIDAGKRSIFYAIEHESVKLDGTGKTPAGKTKEEDIMTFLKRDDSVASTPALASLVSVASASIKDKVDTDSYHKNSMPVIGGKFRWVNHYKEDTNNLVCDTGVPNGWDVAKFFAEQVSSSNSAYAAFLPPEYPSNTYASLKDFFASYLADVRDSGKDVSAKTLAAFLKDEREMGNVSPELKSGREFLSYSADKLAGKLLLAYDQKFTVDYAFKPANKTQKVTVKLPCKEILKLVVNEVKSMVEVLDQSAIKTDVRIFSIKNAWCKEYVEAAMLYCDAMGYRYKNNTNFAAAYPTREKVAALTSYLKEEFAIQLTASQPDHGKNAGRDARSFML